MNGLLKPPNMYALRLDDDTSQGAEKGGKDMEARMTALENRVLYLETVLFLNSLSRKLPGVPIKSTEDMKEYLNQDFRNSLIRRINNLRR